MRVTGSDYQRRTPLPSAKPVDLHSENTIYSTPSSHPILFDLPQPSQLYQPPQLHSVPSVLSPTSVRTSRVLQYLLVYSTYMLLVLGPHPGLPGSSLFLACLAWLGWFSGVLGWLAGKWPANFSPAMAAFASLGRLLRAPFLASSHGIRQSGVPSPSVASIFSPLPITPKLFPDNTFAANTKLIAQFRPQLLDSFR